MYCMLHVFKLADDATVSGSHLYCGVAGGDGGQCESGEPRRGNPSHEGLSRLNSTQ